MFEQNIGIVAEKPFMALIVVSEGPLRITQKTIDAAWRRRAPKSRWVIRDAVRIVDSYAASGIQPGVQKLRRWNRSVIAVSRWRMRNGI